MNEATNELADGRTVGKSPQRAKGFEYHNQASLFVKYTKQVMADSHLARWNLAVHPQDYK